MPTTTTHTHDDRVDAYIENSADFAKPILERIRKLIHKACPEATETIKWSMPFFEFNGSPLCNMAAFKEHCAFGFWSASLLTDPEGILHLKNKESMGHLDRLSSVKDLPADKILLAYIKEAAQLIREGKKKTAPAKKEPRPELPMPPALTAALKKNKKAQTTFEAFPPSHRREYIEWISEAKTDATRDKRIETTIEWLLEGKSRNWKYQKK
jgi:uncharacterized protein YdeI (YjbR/CyaY-like superfamily)